MSSSGRAIGRPRRQVDLAAVHRLRDQGRSWRQVAMALKVPRGTLQRLYARLRIKTLFEIRGSVPLE